MKFPLNRSRGYSLMEVLIALVLVMGTTTPIVYWFFHNEANRSAWNRLEALGVLEQVMHREWLHPVRDIRLDSSLADGKKLTLGMKELDGHVLVQGQILSESGEIEANLELMRFLPPKEASP